MATYQLLDVREEEELYKTRLLNVEEKPFKRITKRLATLHDVVALSVRQEQTLPPEAKAGDDAASAATSAATTAAGDAAVAEAMAQLREDVTLDFAALEASVARLQFLHTANARERTRYAADHGSIVATCQGVRDNMAVLRGQLEQARATLAQRRRFDEMADRITSARTLRPRPDQLASIRKLEDECRQLQADGAADAQTWRERRAQFARIMDESMRLRRLIRDEKEEVERREGMDEEAPAAGAGAGAGTGAGAGVAGSAAGTTTAAGAGAAAGSTATAAATAATADTPAKGDALDDSNGGLRPDAAAGGSFSSRDGSRRDSRAPSREATPLQAGSADDVDMVEVGEAGETSENGGTPAPAAAADTPVITMSEAATPADASGDTMDTT